MRKTAKNRQTQLCQAGHSIFQSKCPKCKGLQREWYNTLANTHFTDIERNGKLITTKDSHFIRVDFQTSYQFEAKRSYYQWAEAKAESEKLNNPKDKTIWFHHAQGKNTCEIAPLVGLNQSNVYRRIEKLEHVLNETTYAIGSTAMVLCSPA